MSDALVGKVFRASNVNIWVFSDFLVPRKFYLPFFYGILCLPRPTRPVLSWVFAENNAAADKQVGCRDSHASFEPNTNRKQFLFTSVSSTMLLEILLSAEELLPQYLRQSIS